MIFNYKASQLPKVSPRARLARVSAQLELVFFPKMKVGSASITKSLCSVSFT